VKTERIAVVLFQLGGPDSTDAVEPFLYNLFRDPDIIDFPGAFVARNALARFIASRRSGRVAENYRQIGGKSPILDLTNAQAEALRGALAPHVKAEVFVAMRYWKPFTAEAVEAVRDGAFKRTFLLPLYPHYSKATTLSSLKEWRREAERAGLATDTEESVCCFFNHPLFIRALAENVTESLRKFEGVPPGDIDIVFSAHGVPVSLVKAGDPYKMQIEETVRLVAEAGGWASPRTLCFQSKVGPMEWLKPSLNDTVRSLAAAGRKNILVVPVAFVTDHIETLHEIDIEARREALHLGVARFEMVPGLNSGPTFIACLADLVLKGLRGSAIRTETCRGVCAQRPQALEPSLCPHWKREGVLRR
jgi:ferrochelatase